MSKVRAANQLSAKHARRCPKGGTPRKKKAHNCQSSPARCWGMRWTPRRPQLDCNACFVRHLTEFYIELAMEAFKR